MYLIDEVLSQYAINRNLGAFRFHV